MMKGQVVTTQKKTDDNDFFGINGSEYPWRSERYVICQNGIDLWVGLQLICTTFGERGATREEHSKAILSYKGLMRPCACRSCIYFKIAKKF